MIREIRIMLLLVLMFHLSAYAQNEALKDAVSKLKTFSAARISEKVYLHFDKPYYAAGDTIYFKAYLTMGERHQPSAISGVLHVDLVNTNNKIDQSIKLQVSDGVAWGDFSLPDSLPKGNYRVRAYTQWMRNDGNYFDQGISVGSIRNSNKISESSTAHLTQANGKPDLQFFPEGGRLVSGIPSKVAFKAIGSNGLGIDVNGVVTDNTGTAVSKFSSVHLGMGYFYLTPEPGKTYRAKVSYPNGAEDTVDLPGIAAEGIVLKINNDSLDKAPIQIMANDNYFAKNRDKPVSLLIYSGGVVSMVTTRLDSALVKLLILKRHLHSGITKVTLFSSAGEPLSERLIFIQNQDQLKLSVSSDKISYTRREKVHIGINALNRVDSAVAGHFSVSVIDEGKMPADENAESTIFNYLLLTSDLKGHIEQPNYYFTNPTDKTQADLDLVMLTHGYRRFEWKQLLGSGYPAIAYQPENNLEITGTAKNLFGKPLANGTVSLIPMRKGTFLSKTTDNNGWFKFSGLVFNDTARFIIQAVNDKGKNNTKLTYDPDKPSLS